MNRNRARDEIGVVRQNVTVLANARDFTVALELSQHLPQLYARVAFDAELARDLVPIERAIALAPHKIEHPFTQIVFAHERTDNGDCRSLEMKTIVALLLSTAAAA